MHKNNEEFVIATCELSSCEQTIVILLPLLARKTLFLPWK